MTATEPAPVRRDVEGIPARTNAAIREVELHARRSVQEMVIPRWLTDADGILVPGGLGIIADSALGTAVMSTVSLEHGMVTSHLHLELLQPVPPGTSVVRAEGRQGWLRDRFGFGEGEITTDDGNPIAKASIGSLLLDRPRRFARPAPAPAPATAEAPATSPPSHPLVAGVPVYEALRTVVIHTDSDVVRISMRAAPDLANSAGGVHGGVGVLMGERVLDLALRHALAGTRSMRLVELRAAFVRPIVADGRRVECRAVIAHLGRRLAAIRGEVFDQDGRPAVLVDATYISE